MLPYPAPNLCFFFLVLSSLETETFLNIKSICVQTKQFPTLFSLLSFVLHGNQFKCWHGTINLNAKIFWNILPNTWLFHSKDRSSICMNCWKLTGFFGSWHLSFPYVALGIALLMWPHNLWLSYIGGMQLIVLALLRMFTIFRIAYRRRGESLLPEFDDQNDKWVFLFDFDYINLTFKIFWWD